MHEKLLKPYSPKETESNIYKLWEDSGYFNPDNLPGDRKEPFSMVLPPPNATGILHIGHAFEDSLQDAIVRFERMRGKRTLWIPGTDHAAIATNTKVEKDLIKNEGKNRHDIGREAFITRVEEFVAGSRGIIQKQLRTLGVSVDWSREAFTFDEKRNLAVNEAFRQLYEAGLIYRGYRVVNWDPKGQTTIADSEVEHKEEKGILYTFRYSKEFPISISTTRPETKVGDTAVAVHPEDTRYSKYVGKTFEIDFAGKKLSIRIIADEAVDPEFGTGALGVTPAHSQIDFEMSERHELPLIQVINEFAKMTDEAGPLVAGKKTKEAREIVVEWLRENELLEKEEVITQNISVAERSGGVIEPLPKLQWFVTVNTPIKNREGKTLKDLMREAVSSGDISIIPDRFEKIYFHWIDNLRDWCISRQLWYGHQIPVWYKGEEVTVGEKPKRDDWTQDEDTLDTWFSAGLWSFTTLGWPNENLDLKTYHPTSLLVPGYEILFPWAARMILMSTFLMKEIPFKTLYLHGMVRDKSGQKFSKSLNNGIDPVDVINEYGADALRMSLIVGVGPGNDINFDLQKVKAYKLFANKLWNIARFVTENSKGQTLAGSEGLALKAGRTLNSEDQKLLDEFNSLVKEVTTEMDEYKFYLVGEKLYHYVWHTFADKIIEESKQIFSVGDQVANNSRARLLRHILENSLKLLHPFMPFVTEEIWSIVHNQNYEKEKMLIIESWPE
ncbi:MAG TPA: valine--tRNA ligase [Candidatus Paceibacterota bacterium]